MKTRVYTHSQCNFKRNANLLMFSSLSYRSTCWVDLKVFVNGSLCLIQNNISQLYFRSENLMNFEALEGCEHKNGIMTCETSGGGAYVATRSSTTPMVVGIVVSILVIVAIVIGTVIYCKRNPETWTNIKRSTQNKV